jgi:hypothetical protein
MGLSILHSLFGIWFLCLFRIISADCGGRDQGKEIVEVLIWSGGSWAGFMNGDLFKAPNYLGHDVDKSMFVLEKWSSWPMTVLLQTDLRLHQRSGIVQLTAGTQETNQELETWTL